MRRNKVNSFFSFFQWQNFPARLIAVILSVLIITCFILAYLARLAGGSDYFKVKNIMASREMEGGDFSYLKGRNIFGTDLEKESRYLSQIYPDYRRIKLIRILPDRIFIDFVRRRPLALVKLYRYFYTDEDMVLFNLPPEAPEADLPVISGLETKIFGPKSGKRYNIAELTLAVNIIKDAKANRLLKDYKIKTINIANPSSAYFVILDDLEIRIGKDATADRINVLGSLLGQLKKDLANIKYIDLRFKEPVVKFKDVTAK